MTKLWLVCFVFASMALYAQEMIEGFWKSANEDTGKRQCVIAIYPYREKYYGRIIATFDREGKMDDNLKLGIGKAPGVKGNPPYCGLDLVWNLVDKGSRYDGKIIDPRKGKVYEASLWRKHENLIIRGKLLFFGKNTVWAPADESDLPPGFKEQDVAKFIPKIPKAD